MGYGHLPLMVRGGRWTNVMESHGRERAICCWRALTEWEVWSSAEWKGRWSREGLT